MNETKFVIIDADYQARNSLARALSQKGYVVQVDTVAELGNPSFEKAFIFVSDRAGEASAVCGELQNRSIFFPVIAYSASPSLSHVVNRMHEHCAGYLDWPGDESELWNTLEVLTQASAAQVRRRVAEARARQKMALLTPRERQVALGIRDGLSSKELARPLGISFRTVELHRANIMAKFETPNVASVLRIIVEAGEPSLADEDPVFSDS